MSEEKEKICVLPCNGLDKNLGVIARETALKLIQKDPSYDLICPVLLNTGDEKYEKLLKENNIIVINGCMTRCASKLIDKRNLKARIQILIPDMVKKFSPKIGKSLKLSDTEYQFAEKIALNISESIQVSEDTNRKPAISDHPIVNSDFLKYNKDKFSFSVPKKEYFFNENDCWVKYESDYAFLGISDYVQNHVGDIMYVDLPEVGKKIDAFDEVGSFESVKTVIGLISPISGSIIEVNSALLSNPELLNQDPYQKGWIIKLKAQKDEEEVSLLLDSEHYFEYMKKKIDDEAKKP